MHASTSSRRLSQVRRVLLIVMALNFLVAAVKFGIGLQTGALTVTADSLHSLLDGSANVVGLLGIFLALRPPDEEHLYGHQKFETIAALAISGLLFVTCFEVLQQLAERIADPTVPTVTPAAVALLAATMAVNFGVSRYEAAQGQRLESSVLLADAAHTMSDVLVTGSVILTLLGAALGLPWVDPVGALVVVAVIGWVGWGILTRSSAILSDAAAFPAPAIEAVAAAVPGVLACHAVRSRRGPAGSFVDLHLEVDAGLTVAAAHDIVQEVEHRLTAELGVADVIIHLDPAGGAPTAVRGQTEKGAP